MKAHRGWMRLACGALLTSIILAGCANQAPQTRPSSAAVPPAVVSPPRSDRGNPPFYDVLGKRYFVLPSSDGYRATGIASWYGRDFHGLSTSSGERYDMHSMTAAHTTLPIPTWVEVTNLANGKRVIVKVNDRGPFVSDRLIDLSYAAATALDIVGPGTARVEVRALGAPGAAAASSSSSNVGASPAPAVIAVPAAAPAPARAEQRMFVQVGAFSLRDNALKLVERLRANGFANPFVVSEDDGRRVLHRVRVGPLRDAQEFDRLSGRLRTLGVTESHLVVDR